MFSTARFDFVYVPEEECAPYDPTVKIVGLPGQTRGSIGVIVERGKRGGKGVKERLGFSGGTVGLSSSKGVRDWLCSWYGWIGCAVLVVVLLLS